MKHLFRAGAILAAVLIIIFVVIRLMPAPEVLEPYGFYREKGDEEVWASRPLLYADPNSCGNCHQDKHSAWVESKHSTVSCENCHGPGEIHVEKQTSMVVDTSRESCAVCHTRLIARPSEFPQVDLAQHGSESACVTCHNPHDPVGATSVMPVVTHTLEGRADCLICHDTGSIKPFPHDHEGRSQDNCLNCHKSK